MKNLIVRRALLHHWDLSVSIAQLVEDCELLDKKALLTYSEYFHQSIAFGLWLISYHT